MESSNSSSPIPFKSKKLVNSHLPSDLKSPKASYSAPPNACVVNTPGKTANPPRRLRHRNAVMSIKGIKQAALKLRENALDQPSAVEAERELERSERDFVPKTKKPVDSEMKLPQKYELLDKFFNSLDSSIRLLQLKRSATTFTNISSQIERLTDRRFTHTHLAQLKFIMPEAIVLEKVLRHDERTGCMKPDLRITLNVEAIDKPKSSSRNLQLRKVFHDRLLDFFKSHPEVDEVPEEALPEPFTQTKGNPKPNSIQPSVSTSTSEVLDDSAPRQPLPALHLSRSFKKSFARRFPGHQTENIKQDQPADSANASGEETVAAAAKSHSISELELSCEKDLSSDITPSAPLPETPVKCAINRTKDENQSSLLKTPTDLASTPAKLMSATPSLRPPKRSHMSPEGNSSRSPNKLVRRPPPNRPLTFDTPVKSVKADDKFCSSRKISSADDDIFDILSESLLQSIQEKERLATMEQDPAISQAKRRRKMIAALPKLFDMIYFLFQSIGRSVVTKDELIQKIVTGHLDIVDRQEVEEQLKLLQELVPEWIFKKIASTGDPLFCVNKISSPDAIRIRLSEAK